MKPWPTRSLGEIATILGGSTPSRENISFWGGDIYWATPTDLPAPGAGISNIAATRNRLTQAGLANCSAPVLPKGAVLFSSRATIGKVAIADIPLATNQGFANFVPSSEVSPRFLAYLLWYHRDDIARLSGSTTFQEVSRGNLRKYRVPVPPLSEQERIVRLLDDADALRKLRVQANRRAADLIPALFHEMFGDPEHTEYDVKPLIEVVNRQRPITYGILKPGHEIDDGIPYVRVVDIKEGRLHVHQLKRTTREIADQYRRSTLVPGDILVTIRGTVGRLCIVPDELKGANITQDTARLAVNEQCEPIYAMHFLSSPWAQNWINHHTQGQAVKGINLGDLKRLPIPVPPLPLQKQFAHRVREIRPLESLQSTSGFKIEALFQSLLHRAFQGEL